MKRLDAEMYQDDNDDGDVYTGDPWKECDMDEPEDGEDPDEIYNDD